MMGDDRDNSADSRCRRWWASCRTTISSARRSSWSCRSTTPRRSSRRGRCSPASAATASSSRRMSAATEPVSTTPSSTRWKSASATSFKNRALLREALTHGSALDGKQGQARSTTGSNFSATACWGSSSPSACCASTKSEEEGELAPRFNALVNRHACARAARAAGLGDALVLSPSEEAQRRARQGGDPRRHLRVGDRSALSRRRPRSGARLHHALLGRGVRRRAKTRRATPRQRCRNGRRRKQEGLELRCDRTIRTRTRAALHRRSARARAFAPARGEGGSKREAQRAAAAAFLKARGVHG